MRGHLLDRKAFTLVEVIASLVLIGILGAIAGVGLVQVTKGYVFSKENAETAQRVQIGMARIVKELGATSALSTTSVPTATSVVYTRNPGPVTSTLSFAGGAVQLNGSTLIGNVTAFALTYFDGPGNQIAAPTATTTPNIRRIDIALTVSGASDIKSTVTNRVNILESYW